MKTTNKIFLLGFVAQDPIDHDFENGTKCTNLVLKTLDHYGPSGEKKIDKNFHNLIMWNGKCEMASVLLKKGDLVYVEGSLKNKRTEGKNGSKATFKVEVVVNEWTKIPIVEQEEEKE